MAPRLPTGFTPVAEAQNKRNQSLYDVIGVCTDYLTPTQSKGTGLTLKVTLWDVTCLDSPGLGQDGMVVRFFADKIWKLPRIEETGDIVILRKLRTKSHGSQWLGLSNPDTRWNVIPGSALLDGDDLSSSGIQQRPAYEEHPVQDSKQGPAPDLQILEYAKEILQIKDPTTLRGPPKSTALDQATIIKASGGQPPVFKQKHRLLQDLVDPREHNGHQFVDLLGEVRRVFHGHNPVEVQLTDYTEHPLLYDYTFQGQDGYTSTTNYWPGPSGQRTMTVCAWDEHAEHIREMANRDELQVGMYVRMKNVQVTMDRNGGMMQGSIRGLPGSSRSNIEFLRPREAEHDEKLKEMLRRRNEYNISVKAKSIGFPQHETTTKRMALEEFEQPAEEQNNTKSSKNAKKKERAKRAKAEKANRKGDEDKILANQHVRCEAVEIPLTTVTSILSTEQLQRETPAGNSYQLPFQNCKYKAKVQVIDFFPDKLEHFATPYRIHDQDSDALSDHDSEDGSPISLSFAQNMPDEVRWEWHFFLVVQDPQASKTQAQQDLQTTPEEPVMLLQVAGKDAEYLLNMEASDLRSSPQDLAKLKEKLFVLWGDLEEKKGEYGKTGQDLRNESVLVSSKPFECLIKEFGVAARTKERGVVEDEWERVFGLFKTNIG